MTLLHRPGSTWLHRLTPGPKLAGLLVASTVVVATPHPAPALAVLVLGAVAAVHAGIGPAALLRALRGPLVVGVLLAAHHLWRDDPVRALDAAAGLLAVVVAAIVLTATTAVDDLLDTLTRRLGPLRRAGVDPDRIALAFALVLRLLPAVLQLAAETTDAARARGLDRSLRARTVPLVLRVVADARLLGEALHARGLVEAERAGEPSGVSAADVRAGMLPRMVQSAATTVDDYLAEQPEDRREALTRIRDLCRAELPGFTEVMAHGMPAYERDGSGGIAFAGQKRHISVYVSEEVREAHAEELAGHDVGRSCLRFTGPARVDYDLVQRLLRSTAQHPGTA